MYLSKCSVVLPITIFKTMENLNDGSNYLCEL